jgi:DeoR family ulaG and ulaABCDEF operon transcriptional repressor
MRVLTNSFEVARILLAGSDNEVIISGGTIYPQEKLMLGPFDTEAIQFCYGDKLFLGARNLSPLGLMEADPLLVQAGRRLISQAQQVIVLADSSKFSNRDGVFLCRLDEVARVVTDDAVPDSVVQMLERADIAVDVVPVDSGHSEAALDDDLLAAQGHGPPLHVPKLAC